MTAWIRKMRLRYQVWRWLRAMKASQKWASKAARTVSAMGAPVLSEQPKPAEPSTTVFLSDDFQDSPRFRRTKDVN